MTAPTSLPLPVATALPSADCDAPRSLTPRHSIRPQRFSVPPGAWDTHAHVIGPFERFPLQKNRSYTPPESREPDYLRHLSTLGLQNGVIVQPSIYGTDNRLTVEVTRRGGESLRGVVVLGPEADEPMIAGMHAAGIRGFRINLLFQGGPGLELLERAAALTAAFGWHAQLLIDIRMLPEIAPRLECLPVPVVFDHMGHFPYELGTNWAGFRTLLRHVSAGRTYVKLSGSYRLSRRPTHVDDVAPIAQALIHEAPERMFWGSDWPHVGLFDGMPCTGELLDALAHWCPSEEIRKMILVRNPNSFYL